jgi:hypothetical protein
MAQDCRLPSVVWLPLAHANTEVRSYVLCSLRCTCSFVYLSEYPVVLLTLARVKTEYRYLLTAPVQLLLN